MKIPPNYTEEQVLDILEDIANKLAHRFRFGYHDIEDIKQMAKLFALEALESDKYDGRKPLANFLWVHMRNRVFNEKRNTYERPDKPCYNCPLGAYIQYNDSCEEFRNKDDCTLYRDWAKRNISKRNLMNLLSLHNISLGPRGDGEPNMLLEDTNQLEFKELKEKIEKELPLEFRLDYLRLLNDLKIPKDRRTRLQNLIEEIVGQT